MRLEGPSQRIVSEPLEALAASPPASPAQPHPPAQPEPPVPAREPEPARPM